MKESGQQAGKDMGESFTNVYLCLNPLAEDEAFPPLKEDKIERPLIGI